MIVLAVDDENEVLEAIAAALKLKGHEVLTANGVPSALAILEERSKSGNQISVVLSDLFMPELSGEDFFRSLRAGRFFPDVSFAIMTGNANREQMRKLIQLGVDGVICKPFSAESLIAALERAVKRKEEKEMAFLLKGFQNE